MNFIKPILICSLLITYTPMSIARMTNKEISAASMENDAQFIECVGNIFFAVSHLQRTQVEDLKWEPTNTEFQKIKIANEFFDKASKNLIAAVTNSDKLLAELPKEKKTKFEPQLNGFKQQVKDLNSRLKNVIVKIDKHELPKLDEIHQIVSLAVAGTGFGVEVSKKNADKNATKND